MKIRESVKRYERWLADQIEIVPEDLATKHEQMRTSAFAFLRGSYPRWCERIGKVVPKLDAPRLPSVGDLHVRNFGTWRDAEGRHVWGIDDFDESEELPYTYDLARLAASAVIAIEDGDGAMASGDACQAILSGYSRGLDLGGSPFILGDRKPRLARLVNAAAPDAAGWWQKLQGELLEPSAKHDRLPAAAKKALEPVKPAADWTYAIRRRVAGMGSLGRRRFVLIGAHDGALAARELKQLAPPAGVWLGLPPSERVSMPGELRSADPFLHVRGRWLVRRLSPDYVKLDLNADHGRAGERRLLQWMGAETANVHLAAADGAAAVRADLAGRRSGWLQHAVDTLVRATRADWQDWRRD